MDNKTAKKFENILNQHRLTKQKFVDTDFPADATSIGDLKNSKHKSFKWVRPHELRLPHYKDEEKYSGLEWTVLRDISPDDICQGQLGNCWFISSLAVVAQKPELIKGIILTTQVNSAGVYVIKLCKDGRWNFVIVDDRLPCDVKNNTLIFATTRRKQLWVCLIEKAMAKLHGSYGKLEAGQTQEGLTALTGYSSHTLELEFKKDPSGEQSKELVWQILLSSSKAGFLMGASCGKDNKDTSEKQYEKVGLQIDHAYSVLNVRSIQNLRLMQLRNPWGKESWKGDWNLQSALWTPALLEKLKTPEVDYGVFWISYDDVIKYYLHVDICQLRNNWFENRVENKFSNAVGTHGIPCYYIEVSKPTELELALYQSSDRDGNNKINKINSESKTDLCVAIFSVSKTQFEQTKEVKIKRLSGYSSRQLTSCVIPRFQDGILQPGSFLALPLSFQNSLTGRTKDFLMSIHSSAPVLVKELTVSTRFLSEAMISFTIENGTKKKYDEKLFLYAKMKQFGGMAIVVENLHEDKYAHIKGSYHESENLVSTRGEMECCDVVPPLHRQLIVILTQENAHERYRSSYKITYRTTSNSNLSEDWTPQAQGHTNLRHYPLFRSQVPENDLHYPRAINPN